MRAILDWLDQFWAALKARKAARAAADVEAGKAIIDQAQREADEMAAAVAAAEARKRLDTDLSGVPVVPVVPVVKP